MRQGGEESAPPIVTGNPPKLRALVFVADVRIEIISLANELLIVAAIAIVPVLGALTNVINGAIVTKLRVYSVIGMLRKGDGRTRAYDQSDTDLTLPGYAHIAQCSGGGL